MAGTTAATMASQRVPGFSVRALTSVLISRTSDSTFSCLVASTLTLAVSSVRFLRSDCISSMRCELLFARCSTSVSRSSVVIGFLPAVCFINNTISSEAERKAYAEAV